MRAFRYPSSWEAALRRDPLPHNLCQQYHPIVNRGNGIRYHSLLMPGWCFDTSIGEPWPPGELAEMGLQAQQLADWDGQL